MPRLNKYYESRSNDKRFKLLHEEASYLDILKGRSGLVEQDPDAEVVEETVLDDGQTLLNEEEEVTLAEFKGKAAKKVGKFLKDPLKTKATKKEFGKAMDSVKTYNKDPSLGNLSKVVGKTHKYGETARSSRRRVMTVAGAAGGTAGYGIARAMCKKKFPNNKEGYKKCMWGEKKKSQNEDVDLSEGAVKDFAKGAAIGAGVGLTTKYAICKKRWGKDKKNFKKCMLGNVFSKDTKPTKEDVVFEAVKNEILDEVSISIARKASKELSKKALAARKARLTPGLARGGKRKVIMGRV